MNKVYANLAYTSFFVTIYEEDWRVLNNGYAKITLKIRSGKRQKNMKIDTKFLGQVEITQEQLVTFAEGIPGFQHEKQFALIPFGENTPFIILQSIKTVQIGFVLALPYTFKVGYAFDLSNQDVEALKIEKQKDIITYAIVTLKDTLPNSTINLLAPIVINTKTRQARQIVLNENSQELLHYPLISVKEGVK